MEDGREVQMALMNSRQTAEYLKRSDLALLPIGCLEMHGPHVPLACDLLNAWATSTLLAQKWDGVVMPPVNYAYPGATGPWPGTVNISPEATIAWVEQVALGIVRGGFKRLMFCSSHAPLGWMLQTVVRSLYLRHGCCVAAYSPYGQIMRSIKEEFGRGGEDIYVLGALRILGWHGAFQPEMDLDAPSDRSDDPSVRLAELHVNVPWLFSRPQQHVAVRPDLKLEDADRAAAAIRRAVDEIEDIPELFARHQRHLDALEAEQPWSKDDVWPT
jgi:creatinine amidohydrolase